MHRMPAALAFALVATVAAGCAASAPPSASALLPGGPGGTAPATIAASPAGQPTPAPVATGTGLATDATGRLRYGGDDVEHPAGTYIADAFAFPFTATVTHDLGVRDSEQSRTFVFIGQDKNAPANADEEWDAMLLTKVIDPRDQRSVARLSGDVFAWFSSHPRLKLVAGSASDRTVAGLAARQADFVASSSVPCGSFHTNLECVLIGWGPPGDEPFALFAENRLRIVEVVEQGTQVLFAFQATADGGFATKASLFETWVESVQFQ